jgi:peptide/nickel transport system permease protein
MIVARYVMRRAGFALLLVFVASSAAFLATRLAPHECALDGGLDEDARVLCGERAELGLDRPMAAQYLDWIAGAARLDFGTSLFYKGRAVADVVGERALNTAILATAALVVATVVGIPLGIFTGMRQRGAAVAIVRAVSLLILSTPPLLASLALVLLAARTGWLPVGGMTSENAAGMPPLQWLIDVGWHLPVPALSLALPLAAHLERLQSQAMVDACREPFVRAAEARGLSAGRARLRHGWPVSLAPVLGVYGLMIGSLFSGSFVVEYVTTWPGLGRLMYDALRTRDLYLVAGSAAAGALFLALGTLIADLMLAVADPRARREARP